MQVSRSTPMLLLALVAAACGVDGEVGGTATSTSSAVGERVRVVVDYSPTSSDVAALLYVTQHPSALAARGPRIGGKLPIGSTASI